MHVLTAGGGQKLLNDHVRVVKEAVRGKNEIKLMLKYPPAWIAEQL